MHVPDCGMAFATLAAAERLLVRGEPVGALLVVSYKSQQLLSDMRTLKADLLSCQEPKLEGVGRGEEHLPPVALLSQRAVWRAATANESTICTFTPIST